MENMETVTDQIAALRKKGYDRDVSINPAGRVVNNGTEWNAADIVVESTYRFEGMSNPDDLAIVMAVRCPDDAKAVLILPYGPDLSGPQADAVRALSTSSDN